MIYSGNLVQCSKILTTYSLSFAKSSKECFCMYILQYEKQRNYLLINLCIVFPQNMKQFEKLLSYIICQEKSF